MAQVDNADAFQQAVAAHDPDSTPKIDLSRVLFRLHENAGTATPEQLIVDTGLEPQMVVDTVTAMESMGLVTVSDRSPTARVVITPLGERAIKALS